MSNHPTSVKKWGLRAGYFLLFLAIGLLIFVVFNHFRPMLSERADRAGRLILVLGFLAIALLARSLPRFKQYWQIPFAFFIACLVTTIDLYFPSRDWLLGALNISIKTPAGIALDKLDTSLVIILGILLLNFVSGNHLADVYLKKGNLKRGLTIGLIAFIISVAGSIPFSQLFFGAGDLPLKKVLSWTPWILIFIAGNAFNEELLFRGLFLQKYEPFVGKFLSNLVIAIPFALHHSGVSYSQDTLMFLALLIPLALAWGYVTQKTGSLWGSILFHAGTDIPIALSIFSNLKP
jgi:membrane protease YdiL (CAAX protease family)